MAPGSSWWRFPPVTLSAAIPDRRHRQGDERPATVTHAPHWLISTCHG